MNYEVSFVKSGLGSAPYQSQALPTVCQDFLLKLVLAVEKERMTEDFNPSQSRPVAAGQDPKLLYTSLYIL